MTRDYLQQHARKRRTNAQLAQGASGGTNAAGEAPAFVSLIVGLGNADARYANTRHNIGFAAVDALYERLQLGAWKTQAGCLVASYAGPHSTIVLAKPQTYMNTCGGAIAKLAAKLGINARSILIVHDELDKARGVVRLKWAGGLNAHNGLRSVSQKLGTRDFCRLQCGIDRPQGSMAVADYVLQHLSHRQLEEFTNTANSAADLLESCIAQGFQKTLNTQ